ncbi:MAG: hypothetical protein SNF33_07720 [Candidatus Algichlamydia australiensis]|nr:hypothetical protein [Chlamydiales bacterium]
MKGILFFLIFSTGLFCQEFERPWFTGPILAPAGHTVAPGKTNYQPYLFVTNNYSPEESWVIDPFVQITRGITSHIDLKFETQAFFTFKEDQIGSGLSDFSVILGFQAMEDNLDGWEPDLRITLGETFPTGQFERLNPNKLGADATGSGSFETAVSFNFQKLFHIKGVQWLRPRLFLRYTIPSPVTVHDFNTYGGGFGTDGKVHPGNTFSGILAFEYSMTRNWVWALDIQAIYASKTTFSGRRGIDIVGRTAAHGNGKINRVGIPASLGSGKSVQWSYAPALEYNFNDWFGVIGGVWFTGATKNSMEFISYVLSTNLVF